MLRILVRHMAKASASSLKPGSLIAGSNVPGQRADIILKIEEAVRGKAGKGGGYVQLKMRDFLSGQSSFTHRFATDDPVELVELDSPQPYTFLYEDSGQMHLMHTDNFDQIEVSSDVMGDDARWLLDGMEVKVRCRNGEPIAVSVPERVVYTVTEAPPSSRKGKSGDKSKTVVLENGVKLRAPAFVEAGDRITVNTVEGEYRGKE